MVMMKIDVQPQRVCDAVMMRVDLDGRCQKRLFDTTM
jgi:hypothetical protein